jgi:protein-S-isoprenylcysteine O-methyltransferase Ste14
MRPLPFVWPYALPFWLVYVWAFAPEFGFLPKARVTEQDRGSMRLVLAAQGVALLLGFVAAFFIPPLPHRMSVFWIGVTMLIAGSLLRRHCFRVLGEHFTFAVTVEKDQKVIDRGAYRWVRHPSYTGGTLMLTGIGVALGNWVSIAILAATTIAAYSYRVMVEERALLATIGEPYRLYMTKRKRFIPFVI